MFEMLKEAAEHASRAGINRTSGMRITLVVRNIGMEVQGVYLHPGKGEFANFQLVSWQELEQANVNLLLSAIDLVEALLEASAA